MVRRIGKAKNVSGKIKGFKNVFKWYNEEKCVSEVTMKKRILWIMFFAMVVALGTGSNVYGEESVYTSSDINRVYITSETPLKSLVKEYVVAKVEVVKKDGTIEIADDAAQVKLRGNSTSKAEKKPFNVKFSSKQSVFGMDKGKKWNLLANAFDKTLLRNKLGLDLATATGLSYISQSTFADVYYNGVLIGNYLVTEPVEAGTTKVDIDESETSKDFMIEVERERYESDVTYTTTKSGIRFAINVPEEPSATQVTGIESFLSKADAAIRTKKASEYSKYIDIDSFVNYYIVSELFKAVDFNYSSTRFYVKNGKMYAGPIWDLDLSSGNASKRFYKAYYNGDISYQGLYCTELKWYSYLIRSDEFVKKVNDRMKVLFPIIENLYQTNVKGKNRIDTLLADFGQAFNRNYLSIVEGGAGWSLTKRYSTCDNATGLEYDSHPTTYQANVELLRNWLKNRANYLQKEWKTIKNNKVEDLAVSKKSATSVKLEWYNDGISDGNEIYIKVENGTFKRIKVITDGDKQSCVIKKLLPGIKYTFRVRSYVKNGKETVYTDFATKVKKIPLKSPKTKVKKLGNNKRKVSWKKVSGAQGYQILGGKSKKKMKVLKTFKGNKKTSYTKTVKEGAKYTFKVRAFVKLNGKKYYSK